jgi:hypothetical protein
MPLEGALPARKYSTSVEQADATVSAQKLRIEAEGRPTPKRQVIRACHYHA